MLPGHTQRSTDGSEVERLGLILLKCSGVGEGFLDLKPRGRATQAPTPLSVPKHHDVLGPQKNSKGLCRPVFSWHLTF